MSIVFGDEGLKDIEIPCVAQTFVNHNSRLFKIFVVGNHSYIVERPSIKNFSPGGKYSLGFSQFDINGLLYLMSAALIRTCL